MVEYTLILGFLFLVLCGAIHDILSYKIPNWISLAILLLFIPFIFASDLSLGQTGLHVGSFALVLVVGFALFAGGIIAGGDAKLIAACALWFGPQGLLTFLALTCFSGGILCVSLIVIRNAPVPLSLMQTPFYIKLTDKTAGAPYGVAIAMGALLSAMGTLITL